MRSGGRRRRRRHSRILFESQRVGALPGTASFAATAQRVVVRRRDAVIGVHDAEVLGGARHLCQGRRGQARALFWHADDYLVMHRGGAVGIDQGLVVVR